MNPSDYVAQITRSARAVQTFLKGQVPAFCLTLGSGLSDLIARMEGRRTMPYAAAFLPKPSVSGHAGEFVSGTIEGVSVLGLSGRTHWYEVAFEPHGILKTVYATHVMASIGITRCFTTNAVGGLNLGYQVGDLVAIRDHINLIPNPLSGPHLDFGGNAYFQPMPGAYDPALRAHFAKAAQDAGATCHEGVYLAVPGRTYETAAECRAFRIWGADTVGMSTTPEIIAATNRGMQTIGVSVVTNVIAEDGTNATNHEEVTAVLGSPELRAKLADAIAGFFRAWRLSAGH